MTEEKTDGLRLSWSEVLARRLERQGLSAPLADDRLSNIARAICGAHAQVISAAELSICLRSREATRQDVREALWKDHSLIKTYGPRGTVHLLPAEDLPMWTGALSALPYSTTADSGNRLLSPEQTEAVIAAIGAVLEGAELTTDELTTALAQRLGGWAADPVMPAFQTLWPRWRSVQAVAGFRGAYIFGPNRGSKVTFINPRDWLPGFQPADGRAALAWLVRRFLHAYGPATPQHFAQWLAIPRPVAVQLFAELAGELQAVDVEGDRAWIAAGDHAVPDTVPHCVRLLPYFDAYVVGSQPRERVFPGRAAERTLSRSQAGNYPVLLVNGTVAGVWHQKRSGLKIEITVEALEELNAGQRAALSRQVERIGVILEATPQWSFGTVTIGPHA